MSGGGAVPPQTAPRPPHPPAPRHEREEDQTQGTCKGSGSCLAGGLFRRRRLHAPPHPPPAAGRGLGRAAGLQSLAAGAAGPRSIPRKARKTWPAIWGFSRSRRVE